MAQKKGIRKKSGKRKSTHTITGIKKSGSNKAEQESKLPEINGYWGDAFIRTTSTTIDHSTNDNGYLACMRGHFSGYQLHSTTSIAVSNLYKSGRRSTQIVGHGNTGFLITGTGQTASDSAKYISLGNLSRWKPELRRLKGRIDSLRIIACYTGAEAAGASLLYEMAKECGASVSGSTGLTWCGPSGWWLDPGARWQVATSSHKPSPIPKDPEGRIFGEFKMLTLYDGDQKHLFKLSDIDTVVYQGQAGVRQNFAAPMVLQDAAAKDFIAMINFPKPFEPGGVPGAIVTGTITITLKRSKRLWNFVLYSDSLLQDMAKPSIFYRTREGFQEAIQSLA